MVQCLLVITGPTAVGKSALCLDIAQWLGTTIINADSRQLFKGMEIGTAAPTAHDLSKVTHHFVGTLHPDDYFSAAIFEEEVLRLLAHHPTPVALMSGGSMMYIDAVCKGIDDIPTVRDDIRTLIKERLEKEGIEALCSQLQELDPAYYAIVDRKNTRRVVHGLKICLQTGKPYSSFRTNTSKPRPFKIVKIGLNRPREELYQRINQRVDEMVSMGLLEEMEQLLPYRHCNALNTVGYKELFEYYDGNYSLAEAIERIKGNTRRYARKQLTWLKRDENINWFHPDDTHAIKDFIKHQCNFQ